MSVVPLPPVELRQGGEHFLDDSAFVASGLKDAERLWKTAGLRPDSRVLDFGCGAGRFATGLLKAGWFQGTYLGVEVQERHVTWCSEHITRRFPAFRFMLVEAGNERYNPSGTKEPPLPVGSGEVDLFYAYSVFSHMRGRDVIWYLQEIRRTLHPTGRAFITIFCDSGVPDETENPDWWGPVEWRGALHCVLYSIDWFERQVGLAGLGFVDFRKGGEYDRQTAVVLKPA